MPCVLGAAAFRWRYAIHPTLGIGHSAVSIAASLSPPASSRQAASCINIAPTTVSTPQLFVAGGMFQFPSSGLAAQVLRNVLPVVLLRPRSLVTRSTTTLGRVFPCVTHPPSPSHTRTLFICSARGARVLHPALSSCTPAACRCFFLSRCVSSGGPHP
ncbi:hypothetical protein C8R44DRAFT_990705, partial [Mycena epipterygia]